MKRRVLLIDHPFWKREDRAQAHLAERGHELTWCCPGRGDALPELSRARRADRLRRPGNALDRSRPERDRLSPPRGRHHRALAGRRQAVPRHLPRRADDGEGAGRPRRPARGRPLSARLRRDRADRRGQRLPARPARRLPVAPGGLRPSGRCRASRDLAALPAAGDPPRPRRLRHPVPPRGDAADDRRVARRLRGLGQRTSGADPRGKQMADAARFDGAMGGWFKDFLDRWVEL